jgi:hypothetical protein
MANEKKRQSPNQEDVTTRDRMARESDDDRSALQADGDDRNVNRDDDEGADSSARRPSTTKATPPNRKRK